MYDEQESDDYDVLPEKDFVELKSSVSDLKKKSPELKDSVEQLTKSIDSLMALFRSAYTDIKMEKHDVAAVDAHLSPVMKKLDEISSQNEKLAEALLTIIDLLKEVQETEEKKPFHKQIQEMQQQPFLPRIETPYEKQFSHQMQQQFPPIQPVQPRPRAPQFQRQMLRPQAMPFAGSGMPPPLSMPPKTPDFSMELPPLPPPEPKEKRGLFGKKR